MLILQSNELNFDIDVMDSMPLNLIPCSQGNKRMTFGFSKIVLHRIHLVNYMLAVRFNISFDLS